MGRKVVSRKPTAAFEVIPQTRKEVDIQARTPKQREYIRAIREHDITFGMGSAGTGKTFLAALLAMDHLTKGLVDKIVICRPAVEAGGEKLGFLPGGIKDKMDPYIQPIFDAFRTYWSMQTIKQYLSDGVIEIVPLAFMRGRSFNRSFIIADEMQNATPDNLLMLMTRLGEESKIVITGDPLQSDINGDSCFHVAEPILRSLDVIKFIHFSNRDVVRHPTVAKILNVWPNNGIDLEGGDQEQLPGFITNAA
jgi:phosphate starvation-inducible protein PhoH and related proteins